MLNAKLNKLVVSVVFFFFPPFFFRKRYSTRDKHVRVRREYPDNNGYLITCMSHTFLHLTYFIR